MSKQEVSRLLFIVNLAICPCVLDPCLPNPCKHGGDCLVSGDTFTCSCPAPFSGKKCQNGEYTPSEFTLLSELNKRQFPPPALGGQGGLNDPTEMTITTHIISHVMDSLAWS